MSKMREKDERKFCSASASDLTFGTVQSNEHQIVFCTSIVAVTVGLYRTAQSNEHQIVFLLPLYRMPRAQQQLATARWLEKPGVRDAQNEKARLRMASHPRKRAKERTRQPEPRDYTTLSDPHQREPTTIKAVRSAVSEWQFNWGPESSWEKQFNDQLQLHRE
ncbi:hypothetical protein EV424DRAFT_1348742 [Suillus variegatus]|nr:hypothetical protein EV424DRAFT_1348742 [Suillus variegatus]